MFKGELGGWRVLLRKNEMSEGYGELGLRGDPSVGDDSDEVLWGQRLEHGDKELDELLEEDELVVEDHLAVHVLQEDPECLTVSADLLIPMEVWSESAFHLELRPGYGLDMADQLTSSILGNWWTYLWMVLPSLGILICSPNSSGILLNYLSGDMLCHTLLAIILESARYLSTSCAQPRVRRILKISRTSLSADSIEICKPGYESFGRSWKWNLSFYSVGLRLIFLLYLPMIDDDLWWFIT